MKYTREQRAAHKAVRDIYQRNWYASNHGPREKHPLDGLSVREWVAEAREGWPKVPVPADPYKAAQRVREAWADMLFEEVTA